MHRDVHKSENFIAEKNLKLVQNRRLQGKNNKRTSSYDLTIPSSPKYIESVLNVVLAKISTIEQMSYYINVIRIALVETLENAIKHGNRYDKSKYVYIKCKFGKKCLKLTIKDEGNGFNYNKNNTSIRDLNNRFCARGRGLYMIKKCMDEVHFNNKGNAITMVKYFN